MKKILKNIKCLKKDLFTKYILLINKFFEKKAKKLKKYELAIWNYIGGLCGF